MNQKQFQKKKERERRVQKKLLLRREAVRKQKKEEASKEEAYEREYQKTMIVKTGKTGGKTVSMLTDEQVKEQLHKNMEILEGLEKEYQADLEARKATAAEMEGKSAMERAELLQRAGILADVLKSSLAEAEVLKQAGILGNSI